MWRTSQGERVLTGGEAAAFKAGLSDLVEDLAEWGDDQTTGVEAFDALSYGQRLALLVDLAGACLSCGNASYAMLKNSRHGFVPFSIRPKPTNQAATVAVAISDHGPFSPRAASASPRRARPTLRRRCTRPSRTREGE